MQIKIYGIKNCSTMKKAFDKLTALGLDYEFFDYKKQAIDHATLSDWVETVGIDKIMNSKGTTFRNLTDEQKTQAKADTDFAITLMTEKPSIIKRPVVVTQTGDIIVGFDEQAFEQLS
ncbi:MULTISPECIES: Spx/MgsR family RNA polymerase-binding regulatory protein [unclassified Moraxella]|uniref:Spx/MgsR family RNA polymerase-binding regulatory protein n=1 Tax=unclassified Moraxella TaxID=2685852 RepID=UPI003AF52D1E